MNSLSTLALSRLTTAPGKKSLSLAQEVESKIRGEDFSGGNHQALAVARLQASTTLLKESYSPGPEMLRWNEANAFIFTVISEGRILDGDLIREIHQKLSSQSGLREKFVQGGNSSYPPAEDLPELWEIFCERQQTPNSPILNAAEVYQWLVTLHFFEDANGRLARLCADFVLLSSGLLPLSFPTDVAGFVSALAEPTFYTTDDAVVRICEGIEHSRKALRT